MEEVCERENLKEALRRVRDNKGSGVRAHSPPRAIRCLPFPPAGLHPSAPMRSPSLNWMFSRLSLSRFMSYSPLLSFRPSAIVSGSAYLLSPPFGMECLTSLADDMAHYALC
jgi:hypothetical protein